MQQNTHRRTLRGLLLAAVAGPAMLLMSAGSAEAQYRKDDGNARDANPRVGSGGRNESTSRYGTTVNPNNVVYGNITGGKFFRGPIGAGDPRAFRGDTAGLVSDSFIRDSAGGYDQQQFTGSFNSQPFYGTSRGVAAPITYTPPVANLSSGIGSQASTYYNNRLSPSEIAARDARVQGDTFAVPRGGVPTTTILTAPGGTASPQGSLMLSPLSGPRAMGLGDADNAAMMRGLNVPTNPNWRPGDDSQVIDQIRNELLIGGPTPRNSGTGTPVPSTENMPGSAQPLNQQLGGAGAGGVGASSLTQQPMGQQPLSQQPMDGANEAGQFTRRQFATPAQQNAQYRELQRRWEKTGALRPMNDAEAARRFREEAELRRRQQGGTPAVPGANPTTPGGATPGTTPGAAPGSSIPGANPGGLPPATPLPGSGLPPAAPAAKPEPLVIKSLAAGVASPTLAGVLTKAEDLMRLGKYSDAIDQYENAVAAAENNALMTLGRGHAHLGAASYRSAAMDIRRSLAADQTLLAGKYDLRSILPEDRLAYLKKDLADLSAKEDRDSVAPFLLAYISYNTGNEAATAGYLAEVDRREGRPDPVVRLMRDAWTLPAVGGENK